MNKVELQAELVKLIELIESSINSLAVAANPIQKKVYQLLLDTLYSFDTEDGKLISDYDLSRKLIAFEEKAKEVLKVSIWDKPVSDYLGTFKTIEEINTQLNKDYNELEVDVKLLTPIRQQIYNATKYELKQALATQYIQPAKFVLMNQVTGGSTIKEALKMLERWDNGDISKGKYNIGGTDAPNLQKYATQIARDASYGVDRQVSGVIKERYNLTSFVYVGTLLKDSRPLCQHLVRLRRDIMFDELPPLIEQFPQGLVAGTNRENFIVRCGGYNCIHKAFAVRSRNKDKNS